jgi:hypothetical protein
MISLRFMLYFLPVVIENPGLFSRNNARFRATFSEHSRRDPRRSATVV